MYRIVVELDKASVCAPNTPVAVDLDLDELLPDLITADADFQECFDAAELQY